ncbi:MAG: glycoside hydrolase family 3 C-terminal domain-containing protein, partial [Bacteroidales bacterium]|nr:glycoside hydrolase family 3 C-terminal domain-containing protein [Bacteroidales bacterium]
VKNQNIPMVIVLLSRRPLDIRPELEVANAFVAAWLPGTEGGSGISDIIFGDFEPTGKLSHTWPVSFGDVPINIIGNYPGHEALFPYGYGGTFTSEINERTSSYDDIIIFPNPAGDELFLQSASHAELKITISDAMGRILIDKNISHPNESGIAVAHLSPGMYYVTISEGSRFVVKKIIKN